MPSAPPGGQRLMSASPSAMACGVGAAIGVAAARALRLRQRGVERVQRCVSAASARCGGGHRARCLASAGRCGEALRRPARACATGAVGGRRLAARARRPVVVSDEVAHLAGRPSRASGGRRRCRSGRRPRRRSGTGVACGMPVHRSCAARVWPAPEMSSSSPSMVSSAVVVMSCGRTSWPSTSQVPLTSAKSWNTRLDGVEVVLGRHVEHGVVLVVELAVRLGAVVVAAHQVEEVVVVRLSGGGRGSSPRSRCAAGSPGRRGGRRPG